MQIAVKYVIIISVCAVIITAASVLTLPSEQANNTAIIYTVKEYNGKIAIFESGSETPLEILDVIISSLPISDRTKLENGITAYNDDQLLSIIEDYDG